MFQQPSVQLSPLQGLSLIRCRHDMLNQIAEVAGEPRAVQVSCGVLVKEGIKQKNK